MKSLLARALALAFLFASEAQTHAVLVYEVSAPVNGSGQLGITDIATGNPSIGDDARVTFGTLQETIYFDPIAGTLRQVGYVPLIVENPAMFTETRNGVTAVVTVNQSFAIDRFNFDTGAQPLIFDSETHAHLGNPSGASTLGAFGLLPQVNASWSLLTGGITYTGNFSYQLTGGAFLPFQDIEFSSDDQSLITLDHMVTGSPHFPGNVVLQRDGGISGVNSVTAENGFRMALTVGISDLTDYFSWHAGPATGSIVPEGAPGLLMCGMVFAALALIAGRGSIGPISGSRSIFSRAKQIFEN